MELSANSAKEIISRGKEYFIVFLKKGVKYSIDKNAEEKIQLEHVLYMLGLRQEGVLVINGPIVDESNIREIEIFNLQNKEDVIDLLESDPIIVSQKLTYEIHPWFGFPGDTLP